MTDETQQPANTQQLEARVAYLEKLVMGLQNSSTIARDIDKSFVGRGYAKVSKPVINLIGADQGSWLNGATGSGMAFPTGFGIVTEGAMAGYWIPLYVPPRQIT